MLKRILALLLGTAFLIPGRVASQCQAVSDTSGMGTLRAFHTPGVSMAPTIAEGNFVLVDTSSPRRATGVERGDLVVFTSPEERQQITIGRLVARPGDTISMQKGQLVLNHRLVTEPYAVRRTPGKSENAFFRKKMRQWQENFRPYPTRGEYEADLQDWGPLVLPEHAAFILGDNRDSSYDSRYFGFVPDTTILGYAALVIDTTHRCVRWRRPSSIGRE
jgi:signal peptidase I